MIEFLKKSATETLLCSSLYICNNRKYEKKASVLERSRDWINQAKWDLQHPKNDMEHGFYDWACFSSQQSAEKAVKAVFQKMGAKAWGCSVADLPKELSTVELISEELIDNALELDKAYISTRYPNAHPSDSPYGRYTNGEARRLIQCAENIIRFCEGLLS